MGVELSLHGELDASNARDLEDELRRWVQVGGARRTVIDLRGLADIDSTGLAVLLRTAHRARELGHSLGLRRPAGQVGRMIALAGLDEALPFIDWPPGLSEYALARGKGEHVERTCGKGWFRALRGATQLVSETPFVALKKLGGGGLSRGHVQGTSAAALGAENLRGRGI
jgi:anti-sigma B factor antagonist